MKIKYDVKDDDNFIYKTTYGMITKVVNEQDKETLKAIYRYCQENNVYPNIIDEDKLKIILQLGIAEYTKRYLESEVN